MRAIYEKQMMEAVEAVIFHSPITYSWFNTMSPRLPRRVLSSLTDKTARDYLLYNLQSQLYSDFYIRGYATPPRWEVRASIASRAPFVAALSAANCGKGYWEGGWTIRSVVERVILVHQHGLELTISSDEYAVLADGTMEPGSVVSLRFPKEFPNLSPGFYMACGNRTLQHSPSQQPLIRLYWNLIAPGAVEFMRAATSVLNRAGVPFRLKVLHDPNRFDRCDAAVIYLLKSNFAATRSLIEHIYSLVKAFLKPWTPVFTQPLAPGLGFAEDPGSDESFGQHRCRLLADAIMQAHECRAISLEERMRMVVGHFEKNSVSIEEPYLNQSPASASFEMAQ